jgi:hypothetical protein
VSGVLQNASDSIGEMKLISDPYNYLDNDCLEIFDSNNGRLRAMGPVWEFMSSENNPGYL